jgi:hypothetical protein
MTHSPDMASAQPLHSRPRFCDDDVNGVAFSIAGASLLVPSAAAAMTPPAN